MLRFLFVDVVRGPLQPSSKESTCIQVVNIVSFHIHILFIHFSQPQPVSPSVCLSHSNSKCNFRNRNVFVIWFISSVFRSDMSSPHLDNWQIDQSRFFSSFLRLMFLFLSTRDGNFFVVLSYTCVVPYPGGWRWPCNNRCQRQRKKERVTQKDTLTRYYPKISDNWR